MWEKIADRITEKLTSGKWILTMVGAAVFAYCAVTKILDPAWTKDILIMIITGYFVKTAGSNGGQK